MTLNSYKPLSVIKAIFSLEFDAYGIWQYPANKSSVVKNLPFFNIAKESSILCNG
jgi:hypothetical protein